MLTKIRAFHIRAFHTIPPLSYPRKTSTSSKNLDFKEENGESTVGKSAISHPDSVEDGQSQQPISTSTTVKAEIEDSVNEKFHAKVSTPSSPQTIDDNQIPPLSRSPSPPPPPLEHQQEQQPQQGQGVEETEEKEVPVPTSKSDEQGKQKGGRKVPKEADPLRVLVDRIKENQQQRQQEQEQQLQQNNESTSKSTGSKKSKSTSPPSSMNPDPESGSLSDGSKGLLRWQDLPNISVKTRKSIQDNFGHEYLTGVQRSVLELLPPISSPSSSNADSPSPTLPISQDLLVQAKTGTGKTLAFLVSALESSLRLPRPTSNRVNILVVSPTRELALQIYEEAKKLLRGHLLKAGCIVGGLDRDKQLKNFLLGGKCDIVVGTPGRLLDFFRADASFKRRFSAVTTLVLDEADQLLDMGFRDDIEKLINHLPPSPPRQTLMFSATLTPQIHSIAKQVLQKNHKVIETVSKTDVPTHLRIRQSYLVCPFSHQPATLLHIITTHRKQNPNAKIIVFFNTTKATDHLARVFNEIPGIETLHLSSLLDSRQRIKISDRFRASRSAVLFTSDVSARGVDYPGVSLVVQIGIPASVAQYVHRVGRTGRAGSSGEGVLILTKFERGFLKELQKSVPVREEVRWDPVVLNRDKEVLENLRVAYSRSDFYKAEEAYSSFLGFYRQFQTRLGMTREILAAAAREYALGFLGLPKVPRIPRPLAIKMGLDGIPGFPVRDENKTYRDDDDYSSNQNFKDLPLRGSVGTAKKEDGSREGEGQEKSIQFGELEELIPGQT
ncbi:hypothetical protein HDU76_005137 [Blyttiomyces sp. JEL0837]|nr:hypothetical protein HDU76_005137 [Blyttiomyces sp. JEL0837]